MNLGFTGTRSGCSELQLAKLSEFFREHNDIDLGIHGGCVGADAEFHQMCLDHNVPTELRPGYSKSDPDDTSLQADLLADYTYRRETHFHRNRSIVQRCHVLIACPYRCDIQHGGTWYTINYAQKLGREVIIIPRD